MPVEYNSDFSFSTLRPAFVTFTRAVARETATLLQANVQSFIPDGGGSALGPWMGWEAKGRLRNSIVMGNDRRYGNKWLSKVRVKKGSKQERYALIHEIGGFIIAKGSAMIFPGKDRRTGADLGIMHRKVVKIRAKHFFADGLDKTERELDNELQGLVFKL